MLHARHLALATGVAALLAGACVTTTAAASDDVPFPASHRTWAHVKTVLVGPASAARTELDHDYAQSDWRP